MNDSFVALILTHGRPERVHTLRSLKNSGYTGRWYMVLDDEDKTAGRYRELYGDDHVVTFSKSKVASWIDEGDNSGNRKAIVYARNACWEIARGLGATHFMQLDDDYTCFKIRGDRNNPETGNPVQARFGILDQLIEAMIDLLDSTPAHAVSMLQGGDYIGYSLRGQYNFRDSKIRKCMNSWLCRVDRPFKFSGRLNEDCSAYVTGGHRGRLFLSIPYTCVDQPQTQTAAGGMSDAYNESGTYVKSMMTVMQEPSCVQVCAMGDPRIENPNWRLHHRVSSSLAYAKIVPESCAKGSRDGRASPLDL